jgi:hypothetical protein
MTRAERARARRHFSACLCFLSHVEMYWLPSSRAVRARSVVAERRHALPPDAVRIGVYSHPFPAGDFLGDLDDLLAIAASKPNTASTIGAPLAYVGV